MRSFACEQSFFVKSNDCAIVSCTTTSVIGDSIECLDCGAFCMNSNVTRVNLSYQTIFKSIPKCFLQVFRVPLQFLKGNVLDILDAEKWEKDAACSRAMI